MKKIILTMSLMLLIIAMCFPVQAHALTYTQGYNSGKEAGYEEGYTAGFDDGYAIRSFEAENELATELTKIALLACGVTALICLPISSAVTAFFVTRKRDKEIRELQSQKDTLSTELLRWQNRVLYGIHANGEFPKDV